MGLNPAPQGLRTIVHNSNQTTKVQLSVPAGETLLVSEDLAAQLVAASGHFGSPDDVAAPHVTAAAEVVAEPEPEVEPQLEVEVPAAKTRKTRG